MDKLDFYRQLIQEQLLARAQLRSPQIDHNLLGTLNNGLPTVLLIHQDLRSTAIYGAKICNFQDIATTISAIA